MRELEACVCVCVCVCMCVCVRVFVFVLCFVNSKMLVKAAEVGCEPI